MIKIGIECESIEEDSWGVARIIYKLLEEIDKRPELANEFKFFLFFKSKIPDYPFLKNPIFEKHVLRIPVLPISYSLYYYLYLPIFLWFKGLDLMYWPNYMLPLIATRKNLVMVTDDIYYEMQNSQIPFRYRLAYTIFTNWAVKHATKLMAISEASKKEICKLFGIDTEKLLVNHLGIDINPSPARENSHGDYMLYVGQAFERRHLRETLLAYEKISPEFPNLKFIAVGADRYNPPIIKSLIGEINKRLGGEKITYHAHLGDEELNDLYTHAQIVTYISSREAFGLPPLEALAHGSIPIVADAPVTRELFGNSAFFVKNPISIEDIAETLKKALTDQEVRANIKAKAPEIVKKFTWSAHAERFLNMARQITHD